MFGLKTSSLMTKAILKLVISSHGLVKSAITSKLCLITRELTCLLNKPKVSERVKPKPSLTNTSHNLSQSA